MWILVLIILIIAILIVSSFLNKRSEVAKMSPQEKERYLADKKKKSEAFWLEFNWGGVNPNMVCPHCNEKGKIRTQSVTRKRGVSGGKATAAILTGGFSKG